MPSLVLRLLSILAACVTIVFFIQGGRQLADLHEELALIQSISSEKREKLEKSEKRFRTLRGEYDTSIVELANLRRDQRIRKQESALLRQEIEAQREAFAEREQQYVQMKAERERLHRENIEMRAQGYDPNLDPKTLLSRIHDQKLQMEKLEDELQALRHSFRTSPTANQSQNTASSDRQSIVVERLLAEDRIVVIRAGLAHGIEPDAFLRLFYQGNLIAKVRAARVALNLSVVTVVSEYADLGQLHPGTEIEILL